MIPIIFSCLAVASASWWWIFQRPSHPLTAKDLSSDVPEGMEIVSQLSGEERNALVTAFPRGPDFRWLAAGPNHKTDLDPKQHWKITRYMLGCMLTFSEMYGSTLVCRDKDGTFLGVVAIVPPYKSDSLFFLHFMRSVIPLGSPVPYSMGKDVSARFDAFNDCTKHHQKTMKGIPHYYVAVVGVSEAAQGKGVGRKLLQTVKAIAGDVPFYLDCHDGNVAFYEKQGMKRQAKYELVTKGTEDERFSYNGMVYGL